MPDWHFWNSELIEALLSSGYVSCSIVVTWNSSSSGTWGSNEFCSSLITQPKHVLVYWASSEVNCNWNLCKGPAKNPGVLFILRLLDSSWWYPRPWKATAAYISCSPLTSYDLLPQVDYKPDPCLEKKMAAERRMPFPSLLFTQENKKRASFLFVIAYVTGCSTQISHLSGPRRIEIGWGWLTLVPGVVFQHPLIVPWRRMCLSGSLLPLCFSSTHFPSTLRDVEITS